MLVPPLSDESQTRNDTPISERLEELSALLRKALPPAEHAFAMRAALEAHAMGADEAVMPAAAACGLDLAGEAIEPVLTLDELATASRIAVCLLDVRAAANPSDAVADGLLAIARVRCLTTRAFRAGPTKLRLKRPTNTSPPSMTCSAPPAIGPARAPCAKTFSPGCAFFKSNPPGSNPNAPPIG